MPDFKKPMTVNGVGIEPALGNPSSNGYLLSSTTVGVRSWVAPSSGTLSGSGTSGRMTQWTGTNTIGDSTLTGPASNLLTLAASSSGLTLTVPATGTAALLGTSNFFTVRQDIRADGTGTAAGLYVPWVSGDSKPTLVVGSSSASNNQDAIEAYSGTGIALFARVTDSGGYPLWIEMTDNGTSNLANMVIYNRGTSATPTTGFGQGFAFRLKSSTTSSVDVAGVFAAWNTATHASRKADLLFYAYDTSGREFMRGSGLGAAAGIGFLGAASIARQTVAANATDLATAITLVNDIKAKLISFGLFT